MRANGCLLVLGLLGGCAGAKAGSQAPARPAAASEPVLEVCALPFASDETAAEELDQAETSIEVVPLKHAAAAELACTLNELHEAMSRPVFSWCALPKPGEECQMNRSLWGRKRSRWSVVADPRTNSLVVSSEDPCELPRLLELIGRLDADAQH